MFVLHTSNKTENLLAHLVKVLESSPLSSPFASEVFLIQSQGMERWLCQQLADYFKVWGNYEFLFPNHFFSSMALRVDSNLDDRGFERDCLLWAIESLLRDLSEPVCQPLQRYLGGTNSALKRYQLARQLAQVFDQYQIMRPDMLDAWQQGKTLYQNDTESWQGFLWRRLCEHLQAPHRGFVWLQSIKKLQQANPGRFQTVMPERIMVFGLNTMPPLFLAFLQALAKHCPIHFYLLNPAQTYWADLYHQRRHVPHDSQLPVGGHPLLAALGQQGREFQEILLETAEFEFQVDSFESEQHQQPTNLQQLQNDILNNQLSSVRLQKDGSISLHACHSRMREVQVLKDQLLQALENDPALELRDIAVMAPDIRLYEPFIAAVFSDIQHAIADRSLRLNNALLDNFIAFLKLSQSRFGWQEVLDLLEQPAVYSGFGLSETDLQILRNWISELYVRWGQSAQHKAALGLPALSENTWQAALERLLMGYAFADDSDFILDTLPYTHIEGSSAQALGGVHDFLQLLFRAAAELSKAKSLAAWAEQLHRYSQYLFSETTTEASEIQQLHELFADLGERFTPFHSDDIELDVIINWLEDAIQEHKSSSGFLRGQLTFCSMLPMRTIPFKVIALLGLNEGEFPRIDRYPGFDLLGQYYRKGDRSRRADDRYQFLEILLSARQQLIMTYIGFSNQDNQIKPPSVVVSEMLEILHDAYQLDDLIVHHPLQAFSPLYFSADTPLFSYSAADCQTARGLHAPAQETDIWWPDDCSKKLNENDNVIELNDLFAFYRYPQKYFIQHKLAILLDDMVSQPQEREPFAIDGLEAYRIHQDWIKAVLAGQELSLQKLQAQGRWPAATSGEILYQQTRQEIIEFVGQIQEKDLGPEVADRPVDIRIGRYRLIGKLSHCHERGSLFYRYATLKGRDFLSACLHHLIINRIQSLPTYLISRDVNGEFAEQQAGEQILIALLERYQQGQNSPYVFFTEPAFAYIRHAAKQAHNSRSSKSAPDVAIEQLQKDLQTAYDPYLALACRNQKPETLLNPDFTHFCEQYLLPVWQSLQYTTDDSAA